ncbi:MAG TPA: ethanolamine ammonia lyase-activating protein [Chloroflexota bacterium]|nr:ethanolamine ammonia lyase-activating protein [Chloroflexota bacterium]
MVDQQWSRLFFDDWVAREGLDLLRGYKVDDVYSVELKPWARTGGRAVQIQLDGTGDLNAAYVCEIPPGKALEPIKHFYEEMVYILEGHGSTSVWHEGKKKNSFEWQAGSLFCIPLNVSYQHFNGSGQESVRYLAVNTAPVMMNMVRNEDFIFNNPATFPERYRGEDEYFSGKIRYETFDGWDIPMSVAFSNFVSDVNGVPFEHMNRGLGVQGRVFELANGVLGAHILQLPGGVFSKLHRHGPGAHVVWLKGEGYSFMFPDGGEKVRADWGPGTMIVPPAWWWHSHACVSKEPAQHLALRMSSMKNRINRMSNGTLQSVKTGGSQMDYDDFPPELMEELRRTFVEECTKRGTPMHMEPVYGL